MLLQTVIEWTGTVTGVLGAVVVASNTKYSPLGWISFLICSLSMACYGYMTEAWGLLTLEVCFVLTNLMGLWRWLIKPTLERRRAHQPLQAKTAAAEPPAHN